MPSRIVAFALVAGVLACAGSAWATDAHAKTFTYRTASKFRAEVRAAVSAWNHSGVRVHFKRAARGRRADVKFVDHRFRPGSWVVGRYAGSRILLDRHQTREYGQPLLRAVTYIAVHEIGHMLGLPHRSGCSIMTFNAQETLNDECHRPAGAYPCGPQRTDVRAVAKRFGWRRGGRTKVRRRGFGTCQYARGPSGALASRAMCGARELPLADGSATLELTDFFQDRVAQPQQATCTWRATDGPKLLVIIDRFPPHVPGPSSVYPSGNCMGTRPDAPEAVHSSTRYLTVRASEATSTVPIAGGVQQVLHSVLTAAESAGVGLACSAAR